VSGAACSNQGDGELTNAAWCFDKTDQYEEWNGSTWVPVASLLEFRFNKINFGGNNEWRLIIAFQSAIGTHPTVLSFNLDAGTDVCELKTAYTTMNSWDPGSGTPSCNSGATAEFKLSDALCVCDDSNVGCGTVPVPNQMQVDLTGFADISPTPDCTACSSLNGSHVTNFIEIGDGGLYCYAKWQKFGMILGGPSYCKFMLTLLAFRDKASGDTRLLCSVDEEVGTSPGTPGVRMRTFQKQYGNYVDIGCGGLVTENLPPIDTATNFCATSSPTCKVTSL
jgi:hypothetical protein